MIEKVKIVSFLNALAESIEMPENSISEDTKLEDIAWDSLAIISCIAISDELFDVMLSGDELANVSTVKDIISLISKKI
tara:strand:+ start:500 stop:736 length:237 start_codon:yes stop_codon:yes gene_type:complete